MRPHHKAVIGFAIVLAAVFWALSGSGSADPYQDVRDVAASDSAVGTEEVAVKGTVAANRTTIDGGTVHFVLIDASGDPDHAETEIPVVYSGVLPDAFGPKMVVVTGTVVDGADGRFIEATDIQVGCSSKY